MRVSEACRCTKAIDVSLLKGPIDWALVKRNDPGITLAFIDIHPEVERLLAERTMREAMQKGVRCIAKYIFLPSTRPLHGDQRRG